MPTLQDQLRDIEQDYLNFKSANPRYVKLTQVLDNSDGFGCFGSFLLVCLTMYILIELVFRYNDMVLSGILAVFGGMLFAGLFTKLVEKIIEKLALQYFKITKEELLYFNTQQDTILSKKRQIWSKIRIAERFFKARMNEFIINLENRSVPKDVALSIRKELENEINNLNQLTNRSYTEFYYRSRFRRIDSILLSYNFQQPNETQHVSNLVTASFDRTSSNNLSIITPTQETEPTIESPEIESNNMVETTINKDDIEASYLSIADTSNLENDESFQESLPINELFENRQTRTKPVQGSSDNPQPKIDYLKLQEKRQEIGRLGELYALEWERRRLDKELKMYVNKLVHASQNNDSLGYDIISVCNDGSPMYIEVKTTTENHISPFYLTETESFTMRRLDNYFIYRIFNFNLESGKGELFIIDCKLEIEKHFDIKPFSYKVSQI